MENATEKIKFFFRGIKIDGRTEDYIRKRLDSLNKFLNNILLTEIEIELNKKGKFRVEVMIKTPYNLYRSEETTESIEGSVDIAVDELEIQIKKDKDRIITLSRRGGRSIKKKETLDKNARF